MPKVPRVIIRSVSLRVRKIVLKNTLHAIEWKRSSHPPFRAQQLELVSTDPPVLAFCLVRGPQSFFFFRWRACALPLNERMRRRCGLVPDQEQGATARDVRPPMQRGKAREGLSETLVPFSVPPRTCTPFPRQAWGTWMLHRAITLYSIRSLGGGELPLGFSDRPFTMRDGLCCRRSI